MSRRLRILAISGLASNQSFLLSSLAAEHDVVKIIRPVSDSGTYKRLGSRLAEFVDHPLRKFILRLNREYRDFILTRLEAQLRHEFQASAQAPACVPILTLPRAQLNSAETIAHVAKEQPDVILVAGAPKLCPDYEKLAPKGCFNIHFGAIDTYRGDHNLWRALGDAKPEKVGVSIHWLSPELDAGRLVAWARPAFSSADAEAHIVALCTVAGAELVKVFLRKLSYASAAPIGRSISPAQTSFVHFADRRIYTDICWRLKRRWARPQHIEAEQQIFW